MVQMEQALQGKVFAITGAASGIGLAAAHYLAQRGASLSLADIAMSNLNVALEELRYGNPSVKIIATAVDITNAGEVDKWVQTTIDRLGGLDGAANLAGIFIESGKGISDMEDQIWEKIIAVNLTGAMHCLRAQLRVIKDGGSIVNATSVAGMTGSAQFPAYSTSKHGVIGLTKCAAKEVGHRHVRVNVICPYVPSALFPRHYFWILTCQHSGKVDTPMMANASLLVPNPKFSSTRAIERSGQPGEVAALIGFLLGDESKWITGATYVIDGGRLC
jgi:NAD(P)-dependent dehydrogenase (short-subunit alcohol dehydrogenase family)